MNSESLILEKLLEVKKEIEALPDPLGDYMREKGFDPDKTVLVLPVRCRFTIDWGPYGPPSRIRFSPLVEDESGYLMRELEI